MYDVLVAAVGGKQPNGRFRSGVIAGPYAEHDLASVSVSPTILWTRPFASCGTAPSAGCR